MSALNNPSEHMNFRDVRRLLAAGSPGSAWKGKVAKPTDVQGIRFPSKIQAAVYSTLMLNAARNRTIVREPILDIWSLSIAGKPGRWRPDFLVLITTAYGLNPEASFSIEIHEVKGSRAAESRDWRLRAAAFHQQNPSIPIYVWSGGRGGKPRRQTFEEFCGK